MKKIISIILMLIVAIPIGVKGLTEEERFAKLDVISFETVDGEKVLKVNAVDPDIIMGNYCTYTNEDYEKSASELPYVRESTPEEWINFNTKTCKNSFYGEVVKVYLKSIGFNFEWDNEYFLTFNYDNPNKNEAKLSYNDEDGHESYYNIKITYVTNPDETKLNNAKEVLDNFQDKYSMFGMDLINSLYHYGKITSYENDKMISRFSRVKENIELNPNYKFVTHLIGGGGAPYHATFLGKIGIIKDNIIYDVKDLEFHEYQILYVDKDETGTVFEKAEKRLKEYFNNSISIEVDGSNTWTNDGEEFDQIVNENLGTTGLTYVGHVGEMTLDELETHVVIVEIPKDKLDRLKIRSIDSKTGINVETKSYDVPTDASISVSDVKLFEYVKTALDKENLVVDSAYDISLLKMTDGTLIKKIENGIEVYMPVDNYKENDTVKVYYIKTDSTIGQIIDGKVVKIDNKLYVKFITNHFSTYALATEKIVEPTKEVIENPNTSDNVIMYVILGGISLIDLGITLKKKYN